MVVLEALALNELEAWRAASLNALFVNLSFANWAANSAAFTLDHFEELRALLNLVALAVNKGLAFITFESFAFLANNLVVRRAGDSSALVVDIAEARAAENLGALLVVSKSVAVSAASSDAGLGLVIELVELVA